MFKAILCLILLFSIAYSGHIYSWDSDLHWQNSGKCNQIVLWFSLETGLAETGVIELISTTDWASAPTTDLKIQILNNDGTNFTTTAIAPIASGLLPASSTKIIYYKPAKALVANAWYGLKITGMKTASAQDAGKYNRIEMYTRYDAFKDIYIDLNPSFSYFTFAPVPLAMVVDIKFGEPTESTDADKKKFGSEYPMNLTFTPQINLTKGIIYRAELGASSGFTFKGACISRSLVVPKDSTETNITEVAAADFSCADATGKTYLTIEVKKDIFTTQKMRFQIKILNPNYVSNSNLIIYGYNRFTTYEVNGYLHEYVEKTGSVVETTATTWADGYPKYVLHWGLTYKALADTPYCASGLFYRNKDATATSAMATSASSNAPYNSVRLKLKTSQKITGKNFKLIITMGGVPAATTLNAFVHPGTIATDSNFKSYSTTDLMNTAMTLDSTSSVITISNLLEFDSSNEYLIGFKIVYVGTSVEVLIVAGTATTQLPLEKVMTSFFKVEIKDSTGTAQIAAFTEPAVKALVNTDMFDTDALVKSKEVVTSIYDVITPDTILAPADSEVALSISGSDPSLKKGSVGVYGASSTAFNLLFNLFPSCQTTSDMTSNAACEATPTAGANTRIVHFRIMFSKSLYGQPSNFITGKFTGGLITTDATKGCTETGHTCTLCSVKASSTTAVPTCSSTNAVVDRANKFKDISSDIANTVTGYFTFKGSETEADQKDIYKSIFVTQLTKTTILDTKTSATYKYNPLMLYIKGIGTGSSQTFQKKQLYPSDDISDIIACFRSRKWEATITNIAGWTLVPDPDIAASAYIGVGHALLQPYLINDKWLKRKVSFMNLNLATATPNTVYAKSFETPSMLRLGGIPPVAFDKGIMLFLDDSLVTFGDYASSASLASRTVYCGLEVNQVNIPATCTAYISQVTAVDSPSINLKSYVNHNYILIKPNAATSFSTSVEFNVFLAVSMTTTAAAKVALINAISSFVGFLSASSTYSSDYFDLAYISRLSGPVTMRSAVSTYFCFANGLNLGRVTTVIQSAAGVFSTAPATKTASTTLCVASGETALGITRTAALLKPFAALKTGELSFTIGSGCTLDTTTGVLVNDYDLTVTSAGTLTDLAGAAAASGVTSGFGSGFTITSKGGFSLFDDTFDAKNLALKVSSTALSLHCARFTYQDIVVDATGKTFINALVCATDGATGLTIATTLKVMSSEKLTYNAAYTLPGWFGNLDAVTQKYVGLYSWSTTGGLLAYQSYDTVDTTTLTLDKCTFSAPANILTNQTYQKLTYIVGYGKDLTIRAKDQLKVTVTYTTTFTSAKGVEFKDGCSIESLEAATFSICTKTTDDAAKTLTFLIDNKAGTSAITIPSGKGYNVLVTQKYDNTNKYEFKDAATIKLRAKLEYNLYSVTGSDNFYKLCEDTGATDVAHGSGTASPQFNYLAISSATYTKVRNIRNKFYITFSLLNRATFYYAGSFDINFGFLSATTGAGNVGYEKNVLCKIVNPNDDTVNYLFPSAVVDASFTKMTINPAISLATAAMFNLGSYRVKCIGGRSGDGSCTSESCNIYPTYFETSDSNYIYAAAQKDGVKIAATALWNNENKFPDGNLKLNNTEFWEVPGQLGNVIFFMTPTLHNHTFNSRIFVEFPKAFPPRLNRFGVVTCSLNNTFAACDFVEDRRIMIYPNAIFTAKQNIEIRIYGVTVPKDTSDFAGFASADFRKVWLGIDTDGDLENAGIEQGEIELTVAPTFADANFGVLLLNNFSVSTKYTRGKTNYILNVTIPNGVILKDTVMYIEFPLNFRTVFPESGAAVRILKPLNQTYDLANVTTFNSTIRRIKIVLKKDEDASTEYNIYIDNMPTPLESFTSTIWPIVSILVAGTTNKYYRTMEGSVAATLNSWDNDAGKFDLAWKFNGVTNLACEYSCPILNVKQEVFESQLSLVTKSGTAFERAYNLSYSGSEFVIYPTAPALVIGKLSADFYIAGKIKTTTPKDYSTQFAKVGADDKYTTLPPVQIRLIGDNATIPAPTVPVILQNFSSLPVAFDVSNVLPVDDLTINFGLDVQGWDNLTLSFEKSSIKLTKTAPRGFLIIKSGANLSSIPSKLPVLYFSYDGTNRLAYNILANQTLSITTVTSSTPGYGVAITSAYTKANPSAGKVSLSIGCTQKGYLYYAITVGANTLTKDQIKAKTYDIGIQQTSVDADWSVFGYKAIETDAQVPFDVSGIKAGGRYNMTWYCVGPFNTSIAYNDYWNQTSNGGKLIKMIFTFNVTPTSPQKLAIAKAIAIELKILLSRVMTDEGNVPTRMLQNSTNTTTTTTTTTKYNSTITISPDLSVASDNLDQIIAGAYTGTTMWTKIAAAAPGLTCTAVSTSATDVSSSAAVAPAFGSTTPTPTITSTSLSFGLSINMNGYIYVGLFQTTGKTVTAPTFSQLVAGTDGSGTAATRPTGFNAIVTANVSNTYLFSGLTANTGYAFYFAAKNDDPSSSALTTSVYVATATTSATSNTTNNTTTPKFSSITQTFLLGFLALIICFIL